jgi:hypothetical protein
MTLLPLVVLFAVAAGPAQAAAPPTPQSPATCEALHAEIAALDARIQTLQSQLGGAVQGVEQNARNGQALAQGAQALGWATGLASLVPGVGFAASTAGAAVTHRAIEAQQRATTARTLTLAEVVQELTPLGQRRQVLRQDAAAQGCPAASSAPVAP